MKVHKIILIVCLLLSCSLLFGCSDNKANEKKPNKGEQLDQEEQSDQSGKGDQKVVTITADQLAQSETSEKNNSTKEWLKNDAYNDFALTGDANPYYMGRWFKKEIDGVSHMVTLNDGSVIYFAVKDATSVKLDFTMITSTEVPYFAYSIDGSTPVRQKVNNGVVNIPDKGYHIIRVITDGLTESVGKWDKECGFALKGISVSGGKMIGIKPTDKTIFFYGDSITEGIAAIGKKNTCDYNSATNAYSWKCAEKLRAVPYIIGYGGTGILNTGSFNTMENAMEYYSKNRPVNDGIIPDLIVINHGHNDGGLSEETFRVALVNTMQKLMKKYPNVPVVYVVPFNQSRANIITEVIPTLGNNFHVVSTAGWNIPTNDGAHPTARGANVAAIRLATELKKIFGESFFN